MLAAPALLLTVSIHAQERRPNPRLPQVHVGDWEGFTALGRSLNFYTQGPHLIWSSSVALPFSACIPQLDTQADSLIVRLAGVVDLVDHGFVFDRTDRRAIARGYDAYGYRGNLEVRSRIRARFLSEDSATGTVVVSIERPGGAQRSACSVVDSSDWGARRIPAPVRHAPLSFSSITLGLVRPGICSRDNFEPLESPTYSAGTVVVGVRIGYRPAYIPTHGPFPFDILLEGDPGGETMQVRCPDREALFGRLIRASETFHIQRTDGEPLRSGLYTVWVHAPGANEPFRAGRFVVE
jgi:hypothetical protein